MVATRIDESFVETFSLYETLIQETETVTERDLCEQSYESFVRSFWDTVPGAAPLDGGAT